MVAARPERRREVVADDHDARPIRWHHEPAPALRREDEGAALVPHREEGWTQVRRRAQDREVERIALGPGERDVHGRPRLRMIQVSGSELSKRQQGLVMQPTAILSYDLEGDNKGNLVFLNKLNSSGWVNHITRNGKMQRLPNTTLVANLSPVQAEATFVEAVRAGKNKDADFTVTHWTLGPYSEAYGGVAPNRAQQLVAQVMGQ